ncbi:DUF6912 family protein [Bowdeniella massiliensis]|uniref:DUF6912 family protein n=1 Tax=Bowdeniella massiliensis TaxID=2932264 RepID=UPI002028DA88|nr:hypothetical protein [Bowdeniella massiliensis]
MRCFLPFTRADLTNPAPNAFNAGARACADTRALQREVPEADEEERELIATLAAGDYSALAYQERPARRIVVAVDARVQELTNPELACDVELAEAITWGDAVALLVDEAAAEECVAAAGSDQAALEGLEDFDLLWFDITERDDVIAQLEG